MIWKHAYTHIYIKCRLKMVKTEKRSAFLLIVMYRCQFLVCYCIIYKLYKMPQLGKARWRIHENFYNFFWNFLGVCNYFKRKNFYIDVMKWTVVAQICITGMFLRPWGYSLPRKIEEQAQIPAGIGWSKDSPLQKALLASVQNQQVNLAE